MFIGLVFILCSCFFFLILFIGFFQASREAKDWENKQAEIEKEYFLRFGEKLPSAK